MARLLYLFSDFLWLLLCIVGYRRKIIERNLHRSFPTLSQSEVRRLRCNFYHRLADYFVETLRLQWISDRRMQQIMRFENIEIIDQLLAKGKSIVVYFSHSFNWEWAPSVTLWSRYGNDPKVKFCQVYRPLKNRFADRWFKHLRHRFGSVSLPKRTTLRSLVKMSRIEGCQTVTGFMSDQKPSHGDPIFELMFLGRPTLVITGTETLARKLGQAVVFWDIKRLRRGHYSINTKLITEDPSTMPEHAITRKYFELLEASIKRDPANWLWSHNRWHRFATHPAEGTLLSGTPTT